MFEAVSQVIIQCHKIDLLIRTENTSNVFAATGPLVFYRFVFVDFFFAILTNNYLT